MDEPRDPPGDPGTRRTIRLRSLRATFAREVVREDAPTYLTAHRFESAHQVFELFRDLRDETRETFVALHLNIKNKLLCMDRCSVGILDGALVHPREIFRGAMLSCAASIVLLHNHPSGDPAPSPEDREVTRRLQEAGRTIGIPIIDHIIIGEDSYYSFRESGTL